MDSHENTPPQMCGFYSITTDNVFDKSASSLRYFKLPKPPMDLTEGIDEMKQKPKSYLGRKLNNILQHIITNQFDFVKKDNYPEEGAALIPSSKYITNRGTIHMIMCSPFASKQDWSVLVTKYKGNIYLYKVRDPEEETNAVSRRMRFSSYGRKFQQICLSDDPSKMPDSTAQIDYCTQFLCVLKRKLVGRDFIFSGEMDGVLSEQPVNLDDPETFKDLKFVELKLCADPQRSEKAEIRFRRFKCPSVWAQCFLGGVQDIYFGFRDEDGMLLKVAHYNIDEIQQKCENYWHPSTSFQFLSKFLQLVEDELEDIDCPHTVYEYSYNATNRKITHKVHKGETYLSFLPDWYMDVVN